MSRPVASISLDLDNKWTYLKAHGDAGWEDFPSYLDAVVPRILDFFARRKLAISVFVVGQDAALAKNRPAIQAIAEAGHEIANHSFHHEPWLHLYSADELDAELELSERAIFVATGQRPVGFRGPGFSLSGAMIGRLAARGYLYDATIFPTFIGPLARAYFFMTARLDAAQKAQRRALYGQWRDACRPNRPYRWRVEGRELMEIPVTTMPFLRLPIHLTYLLFLARRSRRLASAYFRSAMRLSRWSGGEPSLLLHPLDFLGREDDGDLSFFPAMDLPREAKIRVVEAAVDTLMQKFDVLTVGAHARRAAQRRLKHRTIAAERLGTA